MLTVEEAIEKRARIEELYEARNWAQARGEVFELARGCRQLFDMCGSPRMSDVQQLVELLMRVTDDAYKASWADVEAEIAKLKREAAQAQLGVR